ncbi:suppressor protein SRP40-like [Trifolium pratense]|uniref:Suppressor protein SRP40-like n=1 Tax=Trifolium pratense TaxID=57577 RepID=A0A2K3NM52_TRIPR|nr:uncharacterized protein LOC123914325 [Trifolium pratense]PNY04104.1 suppressor protein SRP40-like [Trifolium pratense]
MNNSRRTGMSTLRRQACRRSVEDLSSSRTSRSIFSGSTGVSHTDYSDVFGGPPRSLLVHRFSSSDNLYDEIYRLPEFIPPVEKVDMTLPVFRIPVRNEGFFSDIFGSDDDRKSRDRSGSLSKANSSSALSSEELSPCRPTIGDEVPLSGFTSKLRRPMSVPWKLNSSTMLSEEYPSKQGVSYFPCNVQSFGIQDQDNEYKTNFKSSPHGFSKKVSSPETTSFGSNSYRGVKVFADDWELNSPSESKCSVHDHVHSEQIIQQDDDGGESDDDYSDDDDFISSYVIEINSNLRREDCEASDIDEAIAWAKEKFQSGSSDEESSMRDNGNDKTVPKQGSRDASEYHADGIGKVQHPKKQRTDTEKLDENIRMWSSGKESDIRLLLSTLHHILWPESGWHTIPLVNLIEKSQVKRAYQKARLCLHPDKLQQKGATILHKYVAEQAFSILQDAWAAFISEDVSL